MLRNLLFFILLIAVVSCGEFMPSFDVDKINGYKPVYSSSQTEISIEEPQKFNIPGKIYEYSTYILIQESGNGFHIIDNSNPRSPKKINFFQIPLNNNIAISGNTVYADSGTDLLALAIQADGTIEVNRLENVFAFELDKSVPPYSGFYFECVDETKGKVIGWKTELIFNPQCYY